jgi:hypothetical protein
VLQRSSYASSADVPQGLLESCRLKLDYSFISLYFFFSPFNKSHNHTKLILSELMELSFIARAFISFGGPSYHNDFVHSLHIPRIRDWIHLVEGQSRIEQVGKVGIASLKQEARSPY